MAQLSSRAVLIDARDLPADHELRADIAVVGAGPVGIMLARELADGGRDVLLLESGGFDFEEAAQDLAAGPVDGPPGLGARYLTSSRLRQYGGASNHWAGQMRPLEPFDYTARDFIPDSGWPFPASTLAPYVERVRALLGLPPFEGVAAPAAPAAVGAAAAGGEGAPEPLPPGFAFPAGHEVVEARAFHYNPLRFGKIFRDDVVAHPRLRLVLHATVTELVATPDGARVRALRGQSRPGRAWRAAPGTVVLAAGGIDNARLLLVSDGVQRGGLGNGADLVGRHFMEHLHLYDGVGPVALWDGALPRLFRPTGATLFGAAEPLMRRARLPSVALNLVEGRAEIGERDRHVLACAEDVDAAADGRPLPAGAPPGWRLLNVQAEQTPWRESRVTLTDERDALGVRRAHLAWRIRPADLEAIVRFVDLFCAELARARLGRGRPALTVERAAALVTGGNHHMGTTRMHDDPAHGVTDAAGRVHGIRNLYVAGSSLFPTGGAVNPTLTALALAYRLADRLLGRGNGGP